MWTSENPHKAKFICRLSANRPSRQFVLMGSYFNREGLLISPNSPRHWLLRHTSKVGPLGSVGPLRIRPSGMVAPSRD